MEKKLNILIVDGDVSEAEELENELNREFDIVGTVFDGMKAVDEIIRKKPEVVLIDIMLPYIDGVGVIEKCRECMEYEQLPVFIVLTSIGTEKLIECVNHMDIDYCMMRPFKNEVLCCAAGSNKLQKSKDWIRKSFRKKQKIILRKMIKEQ